MYTIFSFNFTANGSNLAAAPALLGNFALWKPSLMAIYTNYLTYQLLEEASLPKGVIQFIPVAGAEVESACNQVFPLCDSGTPYFLNPYMIKSITIPRFLVTQN